MSVPAAAGDDLPKLEKYELIEEIGHGGMATVYRARDLRLEREVAVKIIHRHLRDNREVATRFIAEGRAAAKLKHRGIVEVYDVSNEEERERYLVAELVRGVTLRQILVDHREMPAEIAAAMVIELCDGLEHAHASGIIHRDVKPENVLVSLPRRGDSLVPASDPGRISDGARDDDPTKSGPALSAAGRAVGAITPVPSPTSKAPRSSSRDEVVIKITDFGIAKILDAQGVTSTGQVLGSPAHMAPEQIDGGEVDPRTDVFALGVVLYEAMVGHLPFDGKNPAQVLRKVLEGKYERAESERPSIGGKFSNILDRALALEPKGRPDHPSALAQLLVDELDELGLQNRSAEIAAYFRDPVGYTEKLKTRLVPTLVTRGEAARRAKKTSEAASHFNRAHALAPDDVLILKRMTQLSSAARGSKIPKRLAMVAAASIGLGALAYGGVRILRDRPLELASTPEPTEVATSEVAVRPPMVRATPTIRGTVPVTAEASASASAKASADAADVRPAVSSHTSASAATAGGQRTVRFMVSPRTGSLTVDSKPVASGEDVALSVGSHSAMITPAPNDDSCVPWPAPSSFVVHERKESDAEVETIALGLSFKPATVTLQGPDGGSAVCGADTLTVGVPFTLTKPRDATDTRGCTFVFGGKTAKGSVTFKAGKKESAVWMGPK